MLAQACNCTSTIHVDACNCNSCEMTVRNTFLSNYEVQSWTPISYNLLDHKNWFLSAAVMNDPLVNLSSRHRNVSHWIKSVVSVTFYIRNVEAFKKSLWYLNISWNWLHLQFHFVFVELGYVLSIMYAWTSYFLLVKCAKKVRKGLDTLKLLLMLQSRKKESEKACKNNCFDI